MKHTSLIEVCVNAKTHQKIYKNIEECIIGYDSAGDEIKIRDLISKSNELNEMISKLETEHNLLVTKYNALLQAYKLNVAKTAMQLTNLEENN